MLERFRTYQASCSFFRACENLPCRNFLKEQLLRAAGSITLNLLEGSAQSTPANRRRYYYMALGSVRECQAVFDLVGVKKTAPLGKMLDELAAQTYKLSRSIPRN